MKFGLILSILSIVVSIESKREPKFAPYIDVTREADFNLLSYKQNFGVKAFSLAFAIGGTGGCIPMWGGQTPIDDAKIINRIKEFKAGGGDVIVSTGGALGPYIETSCGSASALAEAYKKALSVTGSTHIDVDIESSIPVDTMNKALASIQRENPSITVSFTLMVQGDDYGVTNELGVGVLKSAAANGVNVDIVNPMTMEFGSRLSSWGDAVIAAAEATHKQMKEVWPQKSDSELYSMLGVTPMIGRNFNGKIFEPNHGRQLVQWAKQKGVGHLAFWSINRDHGCPGQGVGPGCSSIAQGDFEFTKIFVAFDDGKVDPITEGPHTEPHTHSHTDPHTDPIITDSPPPTTKKSDPVIDCSVPDKRYPHPTDCNKYYWCFNGEAHLESCGPGTVWDPQHNDCDYPKNVNRPECK